MEEDEESRWENLLAPDHPYLPILREIRDQLYAIIPLIPAQVWLDAGTQPVIEQHQVPISPSSSTHDPNMIISFVPPSELHAGDMYDHKSDDSGDSRDDHYFNADVIRDYLQRHPCSQDAIDTILFICYDYVKVAVDFLQALAREERPHVTAKPLEKKHSSSSSRPAAFMETFGQFISSAESFISRMSDTTKHVGLILSGSKATDQDAENDVVRNDERFVDWVNSTICVHIHEYLTNLAITAATVGPDMDPMKMERRILQARQTVTFRVANQHRLHSKLHAVDQGHGIVLPWRLLNYFVYIGHIIREFESHTHLTTNGVKRGKEEQDLQFRLDRSVQRSSQINEQVMTNSLAFDHMRNNGTLDGGVNISTLAAMLHAGWTRQDRVEGSGGDDDPNGLVAWLKEHANHLYRCFLTMDAFAPNHETSYVVFMRPVDALDHANTAINDYTTNLARITGATPPGHCERFDGLVHSEAIRMIQTYPGLWYNFVRVFCAHIVNVFADGDDDAPPMSDQQNRLPHLVINDAYDRYDMGFDWADKQYYNRVSINVVPILTAAALCGDRILPFNTAAPNSSITYLQSDVHVKPVATRNSPVTTGGNHSRPLPPAPLPGDMDNAISNSTGNRSNGMALHVTYFDNIAADVN